MNIIKKKEIVGRNHILTPLGIVSKTKHSKFPGGN